MKHFLSEIFKRVTLKRIVEGRGHDTMGLIADICLDGKVVGSFHDDGWGGIPEIKVEPKAEEEMTKFFNEVNAQKLIEEEVNKTTQFKLTYETFMNQLEFVVNAYADYNEELKVINRNKKNKLIYKDGNTITQVKWGKPIIPLAKLVTLNGGKQVLQEKIDQIKSEGYPILNPIEQLEELGVKV
jgi:hypothetical protein